MGGMVVGSEPVEEYRDEELVVAADQLRLVAGRLQDLGLRHDTTVDSGLGLALLTLTNLGQVALDPPDPGDPDGGRRPPTSALETLLVRLRHDFAARYHGWVPVLGKNRVLRGVRGNGTVKGRATLEVPEPAFGTDDRAGLILAGSTLTGVFLSGARLTGATLGPVTVTNAFVPDGTVKGGRLTGTIQSGTVTGGSVTATLELGGPVTAGIAAGAAAALRSVGPLAAAADPGRGRGVRVGVLDTPLYPHPDLAGRYVAAAEALLPAQPPDALPARAGHATFIAGLIGRQAPAAELDVRAGLDSDATGTVWDVGRKLVELGGSGVQIVNLSLGCFTEDGEPPLVLRQAIERLGTDVLVVASGGNHGVPPADQASLPAGAPQPGLPIWPAALDGVVGVGAHDQDGTLADFSPDVPWIAYTAPGVGVVSTYLLGPVTAGDGPPIQFAGYASWSGTSFAAATVSGVIAAAMKPGQSAREALAELASPLVVPFVSTH